MDYSRIIADLDAEIAKLQKVRDTLTALNGRSSERDTRTRRGGARTMSAAARARISAAQKARWAKVKAKKK